MQKRYVQEIICQIRHEGSPSSPRSSFTGAAPTRVRSPVAHADLCLNLTLERQDDAGLCRHPEGGPGAGSISVPRGSALQRSSLLPAVTHPGRLRGWGEVPVPNCPTTSLRRPGSCRASAAPRRRWLFQGVPPSSPPDHPTEPHSVTPFEPG